MCAVHVNGVWLIASAGGEDGRIDFWDPITAEPHRIGEDGFLHSPSFHPVYALSCIEYEGGTLLASCGYGRGVWLWDLQSGELRGVLKHYEDQEDIAPTSLRSVSGMEGDGRHLLISGDDEGIVRIWELSSGTFLQDTAGRRLIGHQGPVWATCTIELAGREVLATGGDDGTVRLWNPVLPGQTFTPPRDPNWAIGEQSAICRVVVDGNDTLAASGYDGSITLFDPAAGVRRGRLKGDRYPLNALCITVAVSR